MGHRSCDIESRKSTVEMFGCGELLYRIIGVMLETTAPEFAFGHCQIALRIGLTRTGFGRNRFILKLNLEVVLVEARPPRLGSGLL